VKDKLKGMLIALAAVAALGAGGAAIAGAANGGSGADDQKSEKTITGSALDKASAAALRKVGDGKVTQTEAGDEEGAYEVEVTRTDGSQVDVHLDKQFKVLNAKADKEESGKEAPGEEKADDDSGPDANPNEPGHQDEPAGGDGDGETNDD
jgi:hypothetical protein